MASRRIVAEVPEDFFWELKAKSAENKLTQKDMTILAMRNFIDSSFPLEQLFSNPETIVTIKDMNLVKEK